jgi:hypothetical protein
MYTRKHHKRIVFQGEQRWKDTFARGMVPGGSDLSDAEDRGMVSGGA